MNMRMVLSTCIPYALAALLVLLLGQGTRAAAEASGLLVIPTADVLPVGAANVAVGTTVVWSDTDDFSILAQFGILPHLEAGLDHSLTEGETVGNVKVRLPFHNLPLALGVQNVGEHAEWYAVYSSKDEATGWGRYHLGLFEDAGQLSPFVGLELLHGETDIMVEGAAGDQSFASLGAAFPAFHGGEVTVGTIFGQAGGARLYLELGWDVELFR